MSESQVYYFLIGYGGDIDGVMDRDGNILVRYIYDTVHEMAKDEARHGRATAFWEQRGMFRARLVVLDGSRVYTVGTSSGDMEAAKSFLAQYFSVSIG